MKNIKNFLTTNRQEKAKLFLTLTVLFLIITAIFDYFSLYLFLPFLLVLSAIGEVLTFHFIVAEIIEQRRPEEIENWACEGSFFYVLIYCIRYRMAGIIKNRIRYTASEQQKNIIHIAQKPT